MRTTETRDGFSRVYKFNPRHFECRGADKMECVPPKSQQFACLHPFSGRVHKFQANFTEHTAFDKSTRVSSQGLFFKSLNDSIR